MALPAIPLDWGDSFENALARRATANYYGQRARSDAMEDQRKAEAQQYVEPAMRGDAAAMAKLAFGNPQAATAMATNLARMDENQRKQFKEQAEYAANSANAVLQADPADRAAVYKYWHGMGVQRGYNMTLPPEYHPSVDSTLRGIRASTVPYVELLKEQGRDRRHATPGGGAPTAVDLDGNGGGSGGGVPQGDATPYGPAGALPAGTQRSGNAIAGMESAGQPNGGYGAIGRDATGRGNRAYGKYQVMDFNIPTWTAEVIGQSMTPQQFLASPEAQEAVFAAKFGQYVAKYGSQQAAARAWFAGEGGMNNPGARDVNGMTVARYEQGFNNALGGGGGGGPAMGVPGPIAEPPPVQMAGGPPQPPPRPFEPPPDYAPVAGVAQGDAPQADGSGTPLPPQGQGQPKRSGAIFEEDPTKYGYKQRGIVKNGVTTPQVVEGGYFVYRNPQTGEHVLYKPRQTERAQPPPGFRWAPGAEGQLLEPITGGPQDRETIKAESEARRKAENPNIVPGPYPSTSVQGTALNTLIREKILTEQQAAQVTFGRVVTGADGAQYYLSGEQIVGAAGGARPAGAPQGTPQPSAAPAQPDAPAPPPAIPPPPPTGPVPLTPPRPQTMNNEQARDATFADRMVQAEAVLSAVAEQGTKSGGRAKEAIPFGIGNYAQTPEYQQFKQARDNFINAQLRRESGAVIGVEEYRNADKQYFPQPGDTPGVLAQKAENRRTAIAGMARGAGPSYKPPASDGAQPSTPDGATATNPTTGEKVILRNGKWEPLK